MRKETDIKTVRETSKLLLYAVDIHPNEYGIVSHPYTNHIMVGGKGGTILNLTKEEDRKKWIEDRIAALDGANLGQIFMMLNRPYYLTWLKFVKEHLSKDDFSLLLSRAYMLAENPNMDVNVSVSTLIKWFKEADKKLLMVSEEYERWENLPDEVEIWRGVGTRGCQLGISWTTDIEIAKWFQRRFATGDERGKLLHAIVPKKHCLAYLICRNEKEVILDVNAVKDLIEVVD